MISDHIKKLLKFGNENTNLKRQKLEFGITEAMKDLHKAYLFLSKNERSLIDCEISDDPIEIRKNIGTLLTRLSKIKDELSYSIRD